MKTDIDDIQNARPETFIEKRNIKISEDVIQTLSKSTSFVETPILIKNSFLFNKK